MLANHRQNRENASKTSHGSRRYSARGSETGSRYREKAQQYYTSFNGKHKPERALSTHNDQPMTPQQNKPTELVKTYHPNPYIKNSKIDESQLKMKGLRYLDKKGVITNKTNKRYFRDNDLAEHLKINKKQ